MIVRLLPLCAFCVFVTLVAGCTAQPAPLSGDGLSEAESVCIVLISVNVGDVCGTIVPAPLPIEEVESGYPS